MDGRCRLKEDDVHFHPLRFPPPPPIVFNDVYIFVGPIFRFEIRFDFFYEVLLEWG